MEFITNKIEEIKIQKGKKIIKNPKNLHSL
jgi:hypothetical protein